jgi:hypothetical protein
MYKKDLATATVPYILHARLGKLMESLKDKCSQIVFGKDIFRLSLKVQQQTFASVILADYRTSIQCRAVRI